VAARWQASPELIEAIKAATRDLPLAETIDHVIEASGLADYYRADKEGADRLENLNELVNAAALFSEESEEGTLDAFLAHAALEAGEHQAEAGRDALQLMTVHAAKGLEFHTVFITGLEESLFPHEQSANEENGLEEERRLMYVAITRARRRLYLSHAQSRMLHGQIRYSLPSRFLERACRNRCCCYLNRRSRAGLAPRGYSAPAAPRQCRQAGNDSGYRVGQSVAHAKFGTGIIIDFEGRGPDARVQVKFREAGTKWLALAYAKLSAA
jgi:DNA helicase II / ATP-dependent DNA helicase PcrA